MTTTPSEIREALRELVDAGTIDTFEKHWMTTVEDPECYESLVDLVPEVFSALEGTDRTTRRRAQELISLLLAKLEGEAKWDQALDALMSCIEGGGDLPEIREKMADLMGKALEGDPRGPLVLPRIDLGEGSHLPLREAVGLYRKLTRWNVGVSVYHSAGWDEGMVEEILPEEEAVVVQYASGHRQQIKFEHAIRSPSLQLLEDDDLRAMRLRDKEALHKLAKADHCLLLRKVAAIHLNKATTPIIKEELYEKVIPRSEWTAWWKAARAAAVGDPYLKAEGSPTRPTYVLREKPKSLDLEAEERVAHALSLSEAIQRTRDYIKLGVEDATREKLLALVHKIADRDEELLRTSEPAQLLECALYIEKEGGDPISLSARSIFEQVKDDVESFAALLCGLSSPVSRRDALGHLARDLPDEWRGLLLSALPLLSGEIAEVAVAKLVAAGAHAELRGALGNLLHNTDKAPYPVFALLKAFFARQVELDDDWHGHGELVLALLRLAITVDSRRKEIAKAGTLLRSIIQLMRSKGDPFFENASQAELEGMMTLSRMPSMHADIRGMVHDMYSRLHEEDPNAEEPVVAAGFWQSNAIYSTAKGIAKLTEELRLIHDVKLPENQEAIQEAISHGDISENAELDAAREEQDQLTRRAMELHEELERSAPLENELFEPGLATPGCRVRYQVLDTGEFKQITILGPWDIGEEGVASYFAPLARAMLGEKVGSQVVVELPSGQQKLRIHQIENSVLAVTVHE